MLFASGSMKDRDSDTPSLKLPFDLPQSNRSREAKVRCIRRLIKELSNFLSIRTVLDAGCGVGDMSEYLATLGLMVTGVDARAHLVYEAKRRNRKARFEVCNVENSLPDLGRFDLVICMELIEHLENPVRALQNLAAMCNKCIFIGSYVRSGKKPVLWLTEEDWEEDKALRGIACVPTTMALVHILRVCGFEYVSKRRCAENHDGHYRGHQWIELLGSRIPVSLPEMEPINLATDSKLNVPRILREAIHKKSGYLSDRFSINRLKAFARAVWRHLPSWALLPRRLPFGGWWLDGNDGVSAQVRRDLSRSGEWKFIAACLKRGSVAMDIGAKGGFNTVLMAHCVGREGRVIAVEWSPENLRRLRLHVILNRLRQVSIEPICFLDRDGETELFVVAEEEPEVSQLNLLKVEYPTYKVRVQALTLDRYVDERRLPQLDLVRLDAGGGELFVLRGAENTLKILRPMVICTLRDSRTAVWGYAASEIYFFLKGLQYRWFHVTPESRLVPASPRKRYDESLVAVPEERLSTVHGLTE